MTRVCGLDERDGIKIESRQLAELPRRQVADSRLVFAKIESTLVTGDVVRLPLGVFRIRDRAARIARNPATGEPVKVPAKRVLTFLPSRALEEAVAVKPEAKNKSLAKKAGAKKTSVKYQRPAARSGGTAAADDVHQPVIRPLDWGISRHVCKPVQIDCFLDYGKTMRVQLAGNEGLDSICISPYTGLLHERLQEVNLCIKTGIDGGDDARLKSRA